MNELSLRYFILCDEVDRHPSASFSVLKVWDTIIVPRTPALIKINGVIGIYGLNFEDATAEVLIYQDGAPTGRWEFPDISADEMDASRVVNLMLSSDDFYIRSLSPVLFVIRVNGSDIARQWIQVEKGTESQ